MNRFAVCLLYLVIVSTCYVESGGNEPNKTIQKCRKPASFTKQDLKQLFQAGLDAASPLYNSGQVHLWASFYYPDPILQWDGLPTMDNSGLLTFMTKFQTVFNTVTMEVLEASQLGETYAYSIHIPTFASLITPGLQLSTRNIIVWKMDETTQEWKISRMTSAWTPESEALLSSNIELQKLLI